jgi:glycosyltransferase involved in cell wall biosynthesis
MTNNIEYSIVIPVYNAEKTIDELCDRINKVFDTITKDYEIILIDDDSNDESWEKLKAIRQRNDKVKIIHFLRNFGQHNAILCGFKYSKGRWVITLDDDLENPPEEIPTLLEKKSSGYLLIYGSYKERQNSFFNKILSSIFQKIIRKTCGMPENVTTSSFALFHSNVIKNILQIKTTYPFLPAMIFKSVSPRKVISIPIIHKERKFKTSNYTFFKYFKLSLNLLINYSSFPLLLLSILGLILSLASFTFGIGIIIEKILDPTYGLIGWNSMMVALSFIGGTILMGMGIIGEYLRRTLAEVSHGQQYVIEEMY